jgi:carboxyl-terminal processing protease
MLLRTRAILVLVVGTVMGLSLSFSGGLLASRQQPVPADADLDRARVLAEVMARVKRDYVDSVDDAVLLENAIRGMVGDLDPHSQFLDADEYRDIRISTSGSYTGIGIEVGEVDGQVRIITPIAGSPAARSGLRSGDLIVAIDGVAIEPDRLHETISRMRGRAGTPLSVTVQRDGENVIYELRREIIRVASVHQ